jgi:hypothetical protein
MKFWKRLRWWSTAAFLALLLWSWLADDGHGPSLLGDTVTTRPYTY